MQLMYSKYIERKQTELTQMTNLQKYLYSNIERLENDLESDVSVMFLNGIKSSLNTATDWMDCRDLNNNFSSAKEFDRVCVCLNTVSSLMTSGGFRIATSRDLEMLTSFCDIRNLPTD